ncbi:MAG: VOC family protein [Terriglobales bacterium]
MIENRSVPPDTVLPHIVYRDVAEASAWLARVFGFTEHYRYGNPAGGAQMYLGKAWIMLRSARERGGERTPRQLGGGTQSLTVFVEDVEAHFQRAKLAGAKIVEELNETMYGELQYGAEDLDGHHWLFAKHARDVSPEEWGAKVSNIPTRVGLPSPRICYLQIPAVDPRQSAIFYEKVFGWNIRDRDSGNPSFDDATGDVSGSWFTNLVIARQPGILPSIWVDSIEATMARVVDSGGEVVESAHHDFPGSTSWIADFRDPAGNVLGLYQEGSR